MITSLRTALDLLMNKSKVSHLAFINLFLNEGHTVNKKKTQEKNHCNIPVIANRMHPPSTADQRLRLLRARWKAFVDTYIDMHAKLYC